MSSLSFEQLLATIPSESTLTSHDKKNATLKRHNHKKDVITYSSDEEGMSSGNESPEESSNMKKKRNKKMPAEMSSKKPVSRLRDVVGVTAKKPRDPRFEAYSGTLNPELVRRSYGFIRDYEKKELATLEEQLKKEKDFEKKQSLKETIVAMKSRLQNLENEEKRNSLKRSWKKQEASQVKEGKKPFFLKKSDFKKLELVQKYKELKDKGVSMDKVLEKRRKRNAAKDHRHIPYKRRGVRGLGDD